MIRVLFAFMGFLLVRGWFVGRSLRGFLLRCFVVVVVLVLGLLCVRLCSCGRRILLVFLWGHRALLWLWVFVGFHFELLSDEFGNLNAVLSSKSKQFMGGVLLSDSGSGGGRRLRLFDRPECRNCVFKGGSYCWNQCPYNIWRKY